MKISVILPTYNRGKKLLETIKSIENNNFLKKDFELIVVNDSGMDNTEEVVRNIKQEYGNIVYLGNKKNKGPAGTRNKGIKKAKGNLIFFTDDDCLVPRHWMKEYFNFFKENPKVYSAGGILAPKKENFISKLEKIKDKILGINYKKVRVGNSEIKTGFTNNCVYRKQVFKEVGYFDEKFNVPAGEDLEFNRRVSKRHLVAFVPIKVLHNHNYNFDYFLGLIWKQGLGKMPPKRWRLVQLVPQLPLLLFNVLKKTGDYRK